MIKNTASFIVLYSKKIQETKAFFEALDCQILECNDEKCVVMFGAHELHYVVSEPIESYAFISREVAKSKGLMLYAEVNNLDQYPAIIVENGGHMLSDIVTTPWETTEFLFNDPNGYHFVLYKES